MARISLLCLFVLSLAMALPARGDDWKPDEGFTSLYNGKDLTGWCFVDKEGKEEAFDGKPQSTDGRYMAIGDTIVVNPREPRMVQQMWTTAKFPKNFTLKIEFRASVNADSGIFIRKPQLQCRDYLLAGPYKTLKKYKPQEWNTIVVTVKDNVAHCECNGEVLEEALKLPETGAIGLEGDRGQLEYRHIQMKEMP